MKPFAPGPTFETRLTSSQAFEGELSAFTPRALTTVLCSSSACLLNLPGVFYFILSPMVCSQLPRGPLSPSC